MDKNYKLSIGEVLSITKEYCDLMDGGDYKNVYKEIPLLNGDKIENYVTLFCCKSDDVPKAVEEIESLRGIRKEDYKFNSDYCHIATYKQGENDNIISFDENEECGVHAKYNERYSCIEDFFIKFLRFRNDLIDNDIIIRDEGVYQYFADFKRGFEDTNDSFIDRIKQKKKRR